MRFVELRRWVMEVCYPHPCFVLFGRLLIDIHAAVLIPPPYTYVSTLGTVCLLLRLAVF